MKLYKIMLGCKPPGRLTKQHDIFFGIGNSLKELIPPMKFFWKEAKGKIHVDDKFGIDVDDIFNVKDTLSFDFQEQFQLKITKNVADLKDDKLHIGYLKLDKI